MITLERWQIIGRSLTADVETRIKRKQPHAQEEAIISCVKRNRLDVVELAPDGSIIGLIAKDGSEWALLVTITSDSGRGRRMLTHAIQTNDGAAWTAQALQKTYIDALRG